nr:kelch repeat-containing protein [uncultured Methanoregula sp.]
MRLLDVSCSLLPLLSLGILLILAVQPAAAAPSAAFSASPTAGYLPLSVSFSDASTGSPTGWAWFFGDEGFREPWTEQTPAAGWSEREAPGSATLSDGSIVVTGGDYTSPMNDTWRSTDKGATWTRMNASSGWDERVGHSSAVLPDGSIVLTGGLSAGKTYNDTWRSTDQGATWTRMNASSGWEERYTHATVVLPDGSIVLSGGFRHDCVSLNDTWRSTDKGATWIPMNGSSGWEARCAHTGVALPDGSTLVMGGMADADSAAVVLAGAADSNKIYFNDTWRSTDKGATWTRMSARPGWQARYGHASVAMPDGSVVLMGGKVTDELNDVWRSTDNGATWTQANASAGWTKRAYPAAFVLPDGSIVLGGGTAGPLYHDVWRFAPAGSSDRSPVHTYTGEGTYSVALQVYDASGWSSTRKLSYITATRKPEPSGGSDDGPAPVKQGLKAPLQRPVSSIMVNVGQIGRTPIISVDITGVGVKDAVVTATEVSGPGSGVPPPPGIVYEYVDITPARFTEITETKIVFVVPVSWISDHHLTPQEIVLYHHDGTGWEALPTTLTGLKDGDAYYTAVGSGFSRFAITGQLNSSIRNTTASSSGKTMGDLVTATVPVTPSRSVSAAQLAPVVTTTTAVPAQQVFPGFPLAALAIIVTAAVVLVIGIFLIRRWNIRRQNPALFKSDD